MKTSRYSLIPGWKTSRLTGCTAVVFAVLLLSGSINSGDVLGEEVYGEDPYLQKAFAQFSRMSLTSPSEAQQAKIKEIIHGIRQTAQEKQPEHMYQIDVATRGAVGIMGFPALTPLLRNSDPWVRGMTAYALFALDRRSSIPFLIGLLADEGPFRWMNDVPGTTVSDAAESCLSGLVYQGTTLRVPVDEIGQPKAHVRAVQRWYDYHLPYYTWMDNPTHGVYWANDLALYTAVPADELDAAKAKDPGRFKKVLVVLPDTGNLASNSEVVWRRAGDPVVLGLTFLNAGSETINVRWDQRDHYVHRFRLVGPDGRDIPMNRTALRPLPDNVPPLQPIWGGAAIGWSGDRALFLHELYDLSKPGVYRFYYSYIPPSDEAEGRAEEWAKETDLRFWDGRSYVNYFEFLLQ